MIKHWTGRTGAILALAIVISLGYCNDANAYGGSWGSSRGGFGSGGGSWGSSTGGGLLAGRRPIRNLLGLVGGGIGAVGDGIQSLSKIGTGSTGGLSSHGGLSSSGSSRGGLFGGGRLFGGGSTGGWGSSTGGHSSTGGWSSSTGGWSSSTGGWSGSTGSLASVSHSSTGSSIGYNDFSNWSSGVSYGSTGGYSPGIAPDYYNYYDDVTPNYLGGPIYSGGLTDTSYPINSYDTPIAYDSIEDAYSSPVSNLDVPLFDGTLMNTPVDFGVPNSVETSFEAPMLDFGTTPTDFGATPTDFGTRSTNPISPQPGMIFGPTDNGSAPGASGFGDGLPDAPIPDADLDLDSTDVRKKDSEAVLSLKLPKDAKVYINGKLTKTEGSLRQYVSRNLTEEKDYRYRVKAVVEKDGEEIVRTKMVSMRPGKDRVVQFNFSQPQVTTLVLKVPESAEVLLDGKKTRATGKTRTFSTRKLSNEQSWNDYKIEVRYLKNGKPVVEQRTLNLVAGTTERLAIGRDGLVGDAIAKN